MTTTTNTTNLIVRGIGPTFRPLDVALAIVLSAQPYAGLVPYIEGRPGVGKTAGLLRLMPDVVHRPASMLREEDLTGLPYVADGVLRTSPGAFAARALAATADKPLALFIDEINTAPRSLIAALLCGLLNNEWGATTFAPWVYRVAAGNPMELAAGADVSFSRPALLQRFVHLPADEEFDVARAASMWMSDLRGPDPFDVAQGVAPEGRTYYLPLLPAQYRDACPGAMNEVLTYLASNTGASIASVARMLQASDAEQLSKKGFASFRQWHCVGYFLAVADVLYRHHGDLTAVIDAGLSMVLAGTIGQEEAAGFSAWRAAARFATPEDVLYGRAQMADQPAHVVAMLASMASEVALNAVLGTAWARYAGTRTADVPPEDIAALKADVKMRLADPEDPAHRAMVGYVGVLSQCAAMRRQDALMGNALRIHPWITQEAFLIPSIKAGLTPQLVKELTAASHTTRV